MTNVEQSIAAALMPVVDDRAYPVVLPQGTDYPAITFHRVDTERKAEGFGLAGVDIVEADALKSTFQVVVWARSYKDSVEKFRLAKDAMEAVSGVYLETAVDGFDEDQTLYTVVQEYVVWGDLDAGRDVTPALASTPLSDALHAVVGALSTRLAESGVNVYSENPKDRMFVLPAVLVGIESMAEGDDKGDERYPARCRFVLRAFNDSVLSSADLAGKVMQVVNDSEKFGLGHNVSWPESLSASKAPSNPGQEGYYGWSVYFDMTVYLGPDVWAGSGVVPTEVWVSQAPEIGVAHEPDYTDLAADT